MHNALEQVALACGALTLRGFSISGLATYVQVPELDLCFDMGECPLSALPLRHVFLTHAHGDHARCLLRHRALRGMVGIVGEPRYFMPARIADDFQRLALADAVFEGIDAAEFRPPEVTALVGDRVPVALPYRQHTFVSAFDVEHRGMPSLGYTIIERRRKLKPAYLTLDGRQIAALRQQGVEINDLVDAPLITFIGDCEGRSLVEQGHIWASPVVVIEATFVDPTDRAMAVRKGHTHIDEVGEVLRTLRPDRLPAHIVLKHFSMKCTVDEVAAGIARAIPDFARDRIRVLLQGPFSST